MAPAGLSSIALTFNGGGVAASVISNAIFFVSKRQELSSPSDATSVAGPAITMSGRDFVAAASAL
jgi:hypothetical protein